MDDVVKVLGRLPVGYTLIKKLMSFNIYDLNGGFVSFHNSNRKYNNGNDKLRRHTNNNKMTVLQYRATCVFFPLTAT
jgi:hypothetical protein